LSTVTGSDIGPTFKLLLIR